MHMRPLFCLATLTLALSAQSPIQVGQTLPPLLDLRSVDAVHLVPKDARDPAQIEAARKAWNPLVEPVQHHPALRLLLPGTDQRLPLLLAASQALRAQNPGQRLYLAFEPGAPGLWEESAWGALDGGIVTAEDLGTDPGRWRDQLVKAQEQLPGRPWHLWLPLDPGPRASQLLGDGARLVVPAEGPSTKLAALIPPGFTDVEGGLGDLTLRHPGTGERRRWIFRDGVWLPTELPKERQDVSVSAEALYDVHGLLARMRATQLRDRAAILSQSARLDVDLHIQGERGSGADLGFTFRSFEKAGETQEVRQQEVRFNGVKANLKGDVQLPVIEPRSTLAPPVTLELTERYRYSDGGSGGPGVRIIRFEPVDADPLLFEGELRVEETTGRVLEEQGHRSGLPGVVKSERRALTYGELAPGFWGLMRVTAFERWVTPGGISQVQRRLVFSEMRVNELSFDAERQAARDSEDTMLKQTVDGVRYFTKQKDGSRSLQSRMKLSGKGLGAVAIVDSRMSLPVLPAVGFAFFDFDAFQRGIQVNALVAGVFNTASVMIPNLPLGFDASVKATAMLWPIPERPVVNGRLLEDEAVDRNFLRTSFTLGRDLGAGFRLEGTGLFDYNRFRKTKDEDHETPGFEPPPSGWQRGWEGNLGWQFQGFHARALYGGGRRPHGTYGTSADPRTIPEEGRYRYWGGSLGFDQRLGGLWMLHGEVGHLAGHGFDRFLQVGGEARVQGVNTAALPSDRADYAKVSLTLPASRLLRITATLDHARLRAIDNGQIYRFTGLGLAGDIPGFGWFTTVRVNLGAGLQSDIDGLKGVQGYVALLRAF